MTSHDVRRIKICSVCGGAGIHNPKDPTIDVELMVAVPDGYAHPRCCDVEGLLRLDDGELDRIRLCDVSQRTMRAIMDRKRIAAND